MNSGNCETNADGDPFQIPIEGELDLHTFNPRDIKELLPAYLTACREKGIFQVRVIHGKGIGNLRRTVHALLARMPEVASYALAGEHFGGWGATIVNLRPLDFHKDCTQ
jgi:DNA-nicking Smr family endonuclease